MDWNRGEGNWKQVAGKVKAKWGKPRTMTSPPSTVAAISSRKIQERYGLAKDQVKKDIDD